MNQGFTSQWIIDTLTEPTCLCVAEKPNTKRFQFFNEGKYNMRGLVKMSALKHLCNHVL